MTNPERYAGLHQRAREIVDDLEVRFEVERVDNVADPELVRAFASAIVYSVRLIPAGDGAPLLVALTDFPGLAVRFGRWHTEPFPKCGCDACDEQPTELAHDFALRVDALVSGRFSEELQLHRFRRAVLSHAFWGDGWRSSGTRILDRAAAQSLASRGRLDWGSWRPR